MLLPIELSVPKNIKRQVKHSNVVFIEKTKITCVVLPDKAIKEYIFPSEMVIDGDVINRDDLRTALSTWLVESGIKLAETMIIVDGSLIFDTTLTPDPRTKIIDMKAADSFLDSIPFQRMAMIKRPMKSGEVKVLTTNKDLVGVVEHAFEKEGYEMLGVFPDLNLVSEVANNPQHEDLIERARRHLIIYTTKDSQQLSFIITAPQKKPLTQMSVGEAAQQPVQPGVVVAIVLLLVLGAIGVGYWQYYDARQQQINIARRRLQLAAQQKQIANSNTTTPIHVSAKQTPAPTGVSPDKISTTESSPSAKIRVTSVQILYTGPTENLYEKIKLALTTSGEFQVSAQIESREISENRIFISPNTDPEVVNKIVDMTKSLGVIFTQKQASIDGYDLVIELGSYTPTAPTPPSAQSTP